MSNKEQAKSVSFLSGPLLKQALVASFKKLHPKSQVGNPVMFVVFVSSVLATLIGVMGLMGVREGTNDALTSPGFVLVIAGWLWFTVVFANFAESLAEGRGKAQAQSLRAARKDVPAQRLKKGWEAATDLPGPEMTEAARASELRPGDHVLVVAGEPVPGDGEAVRGVASVDESAVTGESAPVIRESGGDRSSVTGGTRVLSDWLVIRMTAEPGQSFLDRMISMVEGSKRRKTPNEIALSILLAGMTIVFLLVCVTLVCFSALPSLVLGAGKAPGAISLIATISLLVCLIPTTIGGLLSAIGISGMDRMIRANVIATSGRAVEAAGNVDVLLLDKTGTITLGNRQATQFIPADGITPDRLADAAQLASLADETPEGRSIVVLAKEKHNLRARDLATHNAHFEPFSAQTRMSGVDIDGKVIRKGALGSVETFLKGRGATMPANVQKAAEEVARKGGTPLVVVEDSVVLGTIYLKDIVKGGIRERFAELRRMGIKTVMITGDNPLTAAAIAAEAGVDDFVAQATPEMKLKLIRDYQAQGRLVAMTGDGTNDAPALAQADVAVAMNTGTQPAKEAGNMVDLDSNPTKLIEIVEIGKQLLMTRGALTTFSIANDVAKYFAIIPGVFLLAYPGMKHLNIMGLDSPALAILSAVIFNALIIVFLIPIALKGVAYKHVGAQELLRNNLLIYGLGGLIVPFVGIKLIYMGLVFCGV